MTTPIILAEMYAGILLIVGVSLFNKKYVETVFAEIAASNALLWITGFVTFLIGLVSLALYNSWSSDWRVIVTIAGWLTLLKGIALMLFPKIATSFYQKAMGVTFVAGGVVAIILGAVLFYCAIVLH